MKLGEYLQKARLDADLSQGDTAKALGYRSNQYISNFERSLSRPSLEIIPKLAKLYNINKDDLQERYLQQLLKDTKKRFNKRIKK